MSAANRSRDLLNQIAEERKRAGMFRTGVMIGVLLMFGLFSLVTYNRVKTFDDDALLVHLQEEASRTVWPLVSRELDGVAKEAVPAITQAMETELENLLPRLSDQLASEAVVFQKNMNKKFQVSLDGAIAVELKTHEAALKGAFGDLSSDSAQYDDLLRRLQASSQQWAMNELDTIFKDHVAVLQSINESIAALRAEVAEERASGKRGDADVDEAMGLFVDILNSKLTEEN